eukprot:8862077-Ditylum_brightwellii.AAC.1
MQELQLLLNWIKWIKMNQGKFAMVQGTSTLQQVAGTGLLPNVDKFLSNAIEFTKLEPKFNESLAYGMLQCHMVKIKGHMNAKHEQ